MLSLGHDGIEQILVPHCHIAAIAYQRGFQALGLYVTEKVFDQMFGDLRHTVAGLTPAA
ncbi:hypothetical protein D3C85_1716110 [compost metagenome]